MATTHIIARYVLYYLAKRSTESMSVAQINFYDAHDQYLGRINFYKDDQLVPDNSEDRDYTPTRVYLKASKNQLPEIVDMLRNEKPCSIYYNRDGMGYLYTGKEPIGEEETE